MAEMSIVDRTLYWVPVIDPPNSSWGDLGCQPSLNLYLPLYRKAGSHWSPLVLNATQVCLPVSESPALMAEAVQLGRASPQQRGLLRAVGWGLGGPQGEEPGQLGDTYYPRSERWLVQLGRVVALLQPLWPRLAEAHADLHQPCPPQRRRLLRGPGLPEDCLHNRVPR